MNNSENEPVEDNLIETIPVAIVGQENVKPIDVFRGSHMWWVTLACLFVAIGLVWWSLPEPGVEINIHFPEGHGLQAEDAVRFRGIDVGRVKRVELNPGLTAVDVTVVLKPFAASLAREGARFWIVRPELSLSGISGLETAVGRKYIGLIPGDESGSLRRNFDGLADPAPDAIASAGIELILRGEKRFGVSAGSPLTCRGVEVGKILSAGLSQDARHVDFRAKVFDKYSRLLTSKTRFWANSGVDAEFSLTGGLKLDTDSLETLARGGISLLTIENGGQPVSSGHVFELNDAPKKEWFESAKSVRLTSFDLRGAVPMIVTWDHDGLFGDSKKSSTFNGIGYRDETGATLVLIPTDMLVLPAKGIAGTLKIGPAANQADLLPADTIRGLVDGNSRFVAVAVPSNLTTNWLFARMDLRIAPDFEDCLAVRSVDDQINPAFLDFPIEKNQLSIDANHPDDWFLNRFDGDKRVWHGSPVLSAEDGKVIGALLVDNDQATIVKFKDAFDIQ